jgi:predicted phage baseplate assembly protein
LKVTANGAAWTAVATLYNQPPTAQVYTTLNLPGGVATVETGDNVEGATFPTGQNNIQAQYRVGIGAAGNVPAGAITTLVSRPVGVGGVTNPMPATGGQDPQSVDDIRANAPLSVLTLGRAVSITDYQNFAATFAGIAKANAIWIANGPYRGVFLTVASVGGVALPPGNLTLANLVTALQDYGNPNVAIYPQTFYETTFGLTANLTYDPKYDSTAVQAAVLQLLQQTYSFAARSFGQGVSSDEVAALIQSVPGVVAVNVTNIAPIASSNAGDIAGAGYSVAAYNTWLAGALKPNPLPRPCSGSPASICPYVPVPTAGALPYAAEILVLDPNPANVTLGVMS